VTAGHYPLWRDITWLEDSEEHTEEIEVCGTCVPKHSGFPSRSDVPEWPCAPVAAWPPGPYLVLAPTEREAQLWACSRGLSRRDWTRIFGPADLAGWADCTCVIVNGPAGPGVEAHLSRLRQANAVRVVRELI
jgi:hypothetical protein